MIAIAVVILLVIAIKARFGTGTPLRGGLPSGHAAVAFGGWAAVTFITQSYENQVLVSTLVFMMALLVAQTRVEARVHTTLEVLYGGVLGAMVTAAIFQASLAERAAGCGSCRDVVTVRLSSVTGARVAWGHGRPPPPPPTSSPTGISPARPRSPRTRSGRWTRSTRTPAAAARCGSCS